MEQNDLLLIERLILTDTKLSQLWHEHLSLEVQLEAINNNPYPTTEKQTKRKQLQKLKLVGRDHIEIILARYRQKNKDK